VLVNRVNGVDQAFNLTNVTSVRRSANWMTSNMAAVGAQTLSYSVGGNTLVTSGGQAQLLNARGVRYYTDAFAATGGTIYGSYLWQTPTLNATNEWSGFFDIRNATGGLDARIGVGVNDTAQTNLQFRYGGTVNTTTLAMAQATTCFMVYKAEYNASGQMTRLDLWVNPADLTSEASAGTSFAYTGTIGGGGFGGFLYEKGNTGGSPASQNPTFDEFRVGTTWADVTPIPEPSAFAALAGLGALGLAAFGRRRRVA